MVIPDSVWLLWVLEYLEYEYSCLHNPLFTVCTDQLISRGHWRLFLRKQLKHAAIIHQVKWEYSAGKLKGTGYLDYSYSGKLPQKKQIYSIWIMMCSKFLNAKAPSMCSQSVSHLCDTNLSHNCCPHGFFSFKIRNRAKIYCIEEILSIILSYVFFLDKIDLFKDYLNLGKLWTSK